MILSAQNLSFSVKGVDLFRGLSFGLDAGETALLTGPSGSGKTALGLAACGFARFIPGAALSGSLSLFGEPVQQGRCHRDAGLVLENPYVQVSGMKRTVGGELAFALECRGVPADEIRAGVSRIMERLRIAHLERRSLATVSGGELKRVVIGACLITEPAFLFLDRPFAEIDQAFRGRLFEIISEHVCRKPGAALIAEDPWLLPPGEFSEEIRLGENVGTSIDDSVCPVPPFAVMDDEPALRVESLTFAYPGGEALIDNFSMEVFPGEILFLEGPNGSGKTTLAKVIAGILKPETGKVFIGGHNTDAMNSAERLSKVGFAPQNPMVALCRRSVREEFELARRWGNDPGRLIPTLDLEPLAGVHPLELSKAEKKRMVIALAYGPARKVIILDEPSQYQDQAGFCRVAKAVCMMAEEGKAVLIISHDPRFRDAFPASRVIRPGR